ncbi:mpv17-like protein isoform X2 [Portunus trituberculatus]|uniref:Mpv17-like protein n=1 Tax=Portunus trituberculatus TaxID=210409 RepID=A0A5B7F2B6_PORTR|nr:mpv17-like protein isoform X2 [Portunus trituberculatus]XP_045112880.1 mpv17-like protein isoform X2 [Portunus trituberculatus]XP_045112881.1 mpv17-like protein isoform X2 [Portunus trituberculatus]XP_045112882.1 mpv17-like protein isoform X2 [Portunus trituberculatus]MPC39328.1 Mpv17-like protein [Portunus trituberculatus]
MQIVAAVRGFMARRPILGNMVVYGTLYSGAEFMQQTFNNKIMVPEGSSPKPYETDTLARYAFMGTCVFPHVLYHAYKFLDSKFVGKSLSVVLPKLAADALIVTPINLTLFYVGMSALERKEDLLEEWRKKIIPTFVTASVFWVPASLINFRFLPPQARVVFVGSCQIVWVSILCWFKRQEF